MNLFDVYPLFDVTIAKGKGCHVWDDKGQEYLDLYGGHAVISIGHCHPHYVEKMTEQLNTLSFYSNSVKNPLQVQLAERLGKVSGYENYQFFLINSGAEANENALKLASFYNGRTRVLSAEKAFHGRTSLAVEATANPKIIAPINANGHVTYLPLNDLEAWAKEIEKGDVCAVILECIQGVGGIRMVEPEFYQGLCKLCSKYDTVLICDEIQCGYGRSGKFFAHQHLVPSKEGVPSPIGGTAAGLPDMITVAKGICNGFPMGGVLISPKFKPVYGQLGTTFGGNHQACAGAMAVLDVIEQEHLVENAAKVGAHLISELKKMMDEAPKAEESNAATSVATEGVVVPRIVDVRGEGLMIGIELNVPYKEIRTKLLFEEHVFTGCSGTHVLRLLPPLCLSMAEADEFLEKFKKVLG